jgi:O-antigen/teichoic acid export membrane protein
MYITLIYFVKEFILLLGPQYRDSKTVILIVSAAYLFNSYKLIMHNPMSYVKSMVKYKSMVWIATAVLNITLNLILIPRFSYNGAAYSTIISYSLTLIPVFILSQKAIFIPFDKKLMFWLILLSAVLLSSLYLEFHFIVKILFYIAYIIALMKVSGFNIKFIKQQISQLIYGVRNK